MHQKIIGDSSCQYRPHFLNACFGFWHKLHQKDYLLLLFHHSSLLKKRQEYLVNLLVRQLRYLHLGLNTLKGGDSTGRLNAGLPNISGQIWNIAYQEAYKSSDSSNGAFSKRTADEGTSFIGTTQQYTADGFVFDASDSNAIYGASTTVQPPALKLIPQIKF